MGPAHDRPTRLEGTVMRDRLDEYLEGAAEELPAIPAVAAQVMSAVEDPNTTREDIRNLIEQDPSMAARTLEIANSALYGHSGRVQSLSQAISLIGSRAVRDLVLGISMKSVYRRFGLMEKLLWTHSTMAGPVTAALARSPQIGIDSDEAFAAGLLHDIGKSALANSHRDAYESVVARVYNEKISFVEAEREQFGFDHAELGAEIASRWNLPAHMVRVIQNHHDLQYVEDTPPEETRLTSVVALATACLTYKGVGRRCPAESLDLVGHPAWKSLGLPGNDVESIMEICDEQIERARALLN
jgi:putative nucleotidyltransferase with HDIG domain